MPGHKNNKKKKGLEDRKKEVCFDSFEEDSNFDASSLTSGQSDYRADIDEKLTPEEEFENELEETVDDLSQKSSSTRQESYKKLCNLLKAKYIPDDVEDLKVTITDAIEKTLKKTSPSEQSLAAKLSTLLCVQLGIFEDAETVYQELRPLLIHNVNDGAAHNPSMYDAKSESCWALSMNEFLSGNDIADTAEIRHILLNIFSAPIGKPVDKVAAFHAAALSSWTLLLTLMTPSAICHSFKSESTEKSKSILNLLKELLRSPHLELRLSAGEALSVIFELGRQYDEYYEEDWALDLVEDIKDLATDSNKFRAKKDRKVQRATFREILRFIEENEISETRIRFGDGESLYLDSWCTRLQYEAFCRILNLDIHLSKNQFIRDIFSLEEPVKKSSHQKKADKKVTHKVYAETKKTRLIMRKKARDQRAAAC